MLLVFIAAYSSAGAQKNQFFDINEHLQKKSAEKLKKVEPKIPFVFLQKINRAKNLTILPTQSKTYTLPNGDRVITNHGYNMPIIVSDMQRFKLMPNAGEDYLTNNFYIPGQPKFNDIPNGAYELPLPNTLLELLKKKSK